MMTKQRQTFLVYVATLALGWSAATQASRVKDIVSIKGVRENQLLGYGLIVGLKGTGDSKKEYTGLSMSQMLRTLGVEIKSEQTESKNVAAVVVTANLPPFARAGSKIDILVSSIGDAKSLEGGTLMLTPLKGADKQVYAVAQGPLSIGGMSASGGGSSSTKNHPTGGMIPNGAIVEREVNIDFSNRNALRLALHNPDFTTAARVSKTINQELGGIYARARDAGTVDVMVPYDFEGGVVELIALIERLTVQTDSAAKVIINERTGTLVVGDRVRISSVAIAHGNLTLEIKESETTETTTVTDEKTGDQTTDAKTVKETAVKVGESGDKLISLREGVTLGDVVRGLNALGVTPRDLIAILQALKAQGALQAELEIL